MEQAWIGRMPRLESHWLTPSKCDQPGLIIQTIIFLSFLNLRHPLNTTNQVKNSWIYYKRQFRFDLPYAIFKMRWVKRTKNVKCDSFSFTYFFQRKLKKALPSAVYRRKSEIDNL